MNGALPQLLFIAAIIAAFWFLILRPQQQQRKQHDAMVAALQPGVRVVTIGGFYGTVISVSEETLMIEIAEGVEVEIARQAVARVIAEEELSERETDTDHSEHDDPVVEGADEDAAAAPELPERGGVQSDDEAKA